MARSRFLIPALTKIAVHLTGVHHVKALERSIIAITPSYTMKNLNQLYER